MGHKQDLKTLIELGVQVRQTLLGVSNGEQSSVSWLEITSVGTRKRAC